MGVVVVHSMMAVVDFDSFLNGGGGRYPMGWW